MPQTTCQLKHSENSAARKVNLLHAGDQIDLSLAYFEQNSLSRF
jgi:hypothetical protein